MRAALEEIAMLVATLPAEKYACRSVSLGVDDAATDALAALPGARVTATVYGSDDGDPYTIEGVEVTIAGVSFRAQRRKRKATPEEVAALSGETRREHTTVAADGVVQS